MERGVFYNNSCPRALSGELLTTQNGSKLLRAGGAGTFFSVVPADGSPLCPDWRDDECM